MKIDQLITQSELAFVLDFMTTQQTWPEYLTPQMLNEMGIDNNEQELLCYRMDYNKRPVTFCHLHEDGIVITAQGPWAVQLDTYPSYRKLLVVDGQLCDIRQERVIKTPGLDFYKHHSNHYQTRDGRCWKLLSYIERDGLFMTDGTTVIGPLADDNGYTLSGVLVDSDGQKIE